MERVSRFFQTILLLGRTKDAPVIKIMDWYLMREMVIPLVYALGAFILLFVVYDLSVHFNEIFEHGAKLSALMQYYLASIPFIFVNSAPIAVLMASLYCLGQLGVNNEITAFQANGVGLLRLSIPFFATGIAMSFLVLFVNDSMVPRFSQMSAAMLQEDIKKQATEEKSVWREFAYQNPGTHRYWVGSFDPHKKIFKDPVVRDFRKDESLESKFAAEEARWIEGTWWLFKGSLTTYDKENKQISVENFAKKELRYPGRVYETPEDFINSRKDTNLMSIGELREHIKIHDRKESIYQSEKVDLHYKVSFAFISLVVIFLGVPLGLSHSGKRGSGAAIAGFGIALSLCLGYYGFTLFALALGKNGWFPAWFAAWLPNVVFSGVGASLFYRTVRR